MHISMSYWLGIILALIVLTTNATIASATPHLGTMVPGNSGGQTISHNTPSYVGWARNLGAANPNQVIDVSVWLKPHDRAGLDRLAGSLYNPRSGNYRHWLTFSAIAAEFGPRTQDAEAVKNFLQLHDLHVISVGPGNFFVRARGTIAQVEAAFRIHIND
jgi:subtilase family serine protease